MMALYTKCLFFYYFFYNWWVSEQKSFLLLKIFSVSYRSDFSGSQSPSLMTVWSSLMKYHQQCHQFWAPANFVELLLDFCVKVSNKNPESETDFWEILAVLLLAWYLPFPFCYFCYVVCTSCTTLILVSNPILSKWITDFLPGTKSYIKIFFLNQVRCRRTKLSAVLIKPTTFHPWETRVILSKIRWIRLYPFLVSLCNIYSSLYSPQYVPTYFQNLFWSCACYWDQPWQ